MRRLTGLAICLTGVVALGLITRVVLQRRPSPAVPLKSAAPDTREAELRHHIQATPTEPAPRLALIDLLLNQRRHNDALDAAREAADAAPASAGIQAALADTLAATGRIPEAIRILRSMESSTPGIKLQLARHLIEHGELEAAVGVLRRLPALSHRDALTAAQLYLDARSPESAITVLQPFVGSAGHPQLVDTYGLALLLAGRYPQAVKVLVPAAERGAAEPALQLYAGSAQRLSGDLDLLPAAETHLRQAAERMPDDALVQYELALTRVQLRDTDGALTAMQQAERLTTEIPEIERDLARLLEHAKQRLPAALARARHLRMLDDAPAAVRELEPWYGREPDNVELALAFCAALHEAGHLPRATASLGKLRAAHPTNLDIVWFQYRLETALQQHDRALITANTLEKQEADASLALEAKAETLQRLARHSEAEPILLKLRDLEPQKAKRHYDLGLALSRWSSLPDAGERAEAALRQALELRPDYAEAHYALGALLQRRGAREEAVAEFRRALDFAPGYADALRALGRTYRLMGDAARADGAHELLRAVQARSDERTQTELPVRQLRDLPRSRKLLYRHYLRTGDLKRATRELEILVKTYPDDPEAHRQLVGLYAHARRFQRHLEEREWLRRKGVRP